MIEFLVKRKQYVKVAGITSIVMIVFLIEPMVVAIASKIEFQSMIQKEQDTVLKDTERLTDAMEQLKAKQ